MDPIEELKREQTPVIRLVTKPLGALVKKGIRRLYRKLRYGRLKESVWKRSSNKS